MPCAGYTISRPEHLPAWAPSILRAVRALSGTMSICRREPPALGSPAAPRESLLAPEGIAAWRFSELTPTKVELWSRAFGRMLRDADENPRLVLASDGRGLSPEFVAAAAVGLRWSGCKVLDLGSATSAQAAAAVVRAEAAGALLVGNPLDLPHTVGLRGLARGRTAAVLAGGLDALAALVDPHAPRPCGKALPGTPGTGPGVPARPAAAFPTDSVRSVLCCRRPAARCEAVERLLAPTACQMAALESPHSHFRMAISSDGEICRVLDEMGGEASAEQLLLVCAHRLVVEGLRSRSGPNKPIVWNHRRGAEVSVANRATLGCLGAKVVEAHAAREAFFTAMQSHDAWLGGGPSGRNLARRLAARGRQPGRVGTIAVHVERERRAVVSPAEGSGAAATRPGQLLQSPGCNARLKVAAMFRDQMPVTRRWAYFDHAAVAPLPEPARATLERWGRDLAENGDVYWEQWRQAAEQARNAAAQMLGAAAEEVALVPSTSAGISLVAEGFPWQAGDNVVTPACEFPANVYPWQNLASRGVETRLVPCPDGRVHAADLAAACDHRTRLVAVSWVQYASGWRSDLAALAEMAHARGALLLVDAIQGLGVFLSGCRGPVDRLSRASDGHKWLLGPRRGRCCCTSGGSTSISSSYLRGLEQRGPAV